MKKSLLTIFLGISCLMHAQNLSRAHVIYEFEDQIVMNDGQQYKVLSTTQFYEVNDPTIFQYKRVFDHVLRLNRVLILQSEKKQMNLVQLLR